MSNDIEKQKVELETLGRRIDHYAQSRSLPLLLLLPVIVFNAALLVATIDLIPKYGSLIGKRGSLIIMLVVLLWVLFSSTLLPYLILKRYAHSFYKNEGSIELQKEKTPIWTWITYIVTFLGPAILNTQHLLAVRWALTISLVSFGTFILYLGKKQKEALIGLVYGLLSLIAAVATAAGIPPLIAGRHSYFASLMIYIIFAGLITTAAVHIYNRSVLRKIKQMRPSGEQQTNKSDT